MEQALPSGAMTPVDPKEVVRRGYDAISYAYRSDDAADGNYRRWISQFQRYLPNSGTVLDLGCGCGIPVCRILGSCPGRWRRPLSGRFTGLCSR